MRPIIVNTDTNHGPGVHWICVVNLPNDILYVYDPLGKSNQRVDSNGEDVSYYLDEYHNIYYYPYPSQMTSSTQCGWFSIYVADLIKKYKKSIHSSSDLDALIQSKFGKTADPGDQRLIHR
jgi:hypothetical protein